ncbi:MAG: hypothetical protein R3C05_15290 [Pirellulaceae bacterium]
MRQKEEIDELDCENGLSIIGETTLKKVQMQDFAAQIMRILPTFRRPEAKTFDDLLKTGFGD